MALKLEDALEAEFPMPSMSEQERIVEQLDRAQRLIRGVEQVVESWRIEPSLFIGTEKLLSEIADIGTGLTPSRSNAAYFGGDVNWVLTSEVDEKEVTASAETLTKEAIKDYGLRIYPPDTILVAMYGQGATRGKAGLLRVPAAITQNCAGIVIKRSDVLPRYVYYFLRSIYELIRGQEYSGGGVPHLNLSIVANVRACQFHPSKNNNESLLNSTRSWVCLPDYAHCATKRNATFSKPLTASGRVDHAKGHHF